MPSHRYKSYSHYNINLVETNKMNVYMTVLLSLPHPNIVRSTKASLGCEDVVIGDEGS